MATGCFGRKSSHSEVEFSPLPGMVSSAPNAPNRKQGLIVTAENALVGKVARVSPEARFAVLNFPIGHLPPLEQHLNVVRSGLKVGELKVTGPQLDDDIVADIIAGEAQAGDEVRDR